MFPSEVVVDLSRFQFALTALYHFIFVPLTLGLSFLLAIMETIYVLTKKPIWQKMVKYWGILFGINFAMGVSTGITMEFQFGTNWAYYSQYVGDIFGAPLAIEGLMAFFLEATFVGIFFFGWDRMSKGAHLTVTWLLAIGTNLSALWILIANGWMQNPVGAHFNFNTMRMEVSDFAAVVLNPIAQAKYVHTVSAGYVAGSMFVCAISAYFLLRNRNVAFAQRSLKVAAAFGLLVSLAVVVLGDESGYLTGQAQKMKLAAIEATWDTEPAPASFTLFGFPDQKTQAVRDAIHIPYLLGLIATRSVSEPVQGINNLVADNEQRIQKGILAYAALQRLEQNDNDVSAKAALAAHENDLGYALLLKRYTPTITDANAAQIHAAAEDTVPNVAPLFWSFRIMVACGLFFIVLFALCFYWGAKDKLIQKRWFLRTLFYSLPLPWVAIELGWFVAENGRQPWVIDGVLPTFLGTSSLTSSDLWISLGGFVLLYTVLAIVELFLMVKYIKLGPEGTVSVKE